jgi:Amt family ammonium transporter
VHSVGGWGGLIGAIMLGPRLGKFTPDGKSRAIAGHSMPLATIGVFILWLGWFGFNGGSVLSADPGKVSLVLVTTNLAAAAGVVASMIISWIVQKKPDLSMILNGALAGLVGITAGADCVTPMEAILIGAIAGVIVVFAVLLIDQKLRIDDPVGAISVHLLCGIFGTLAAGIFGEGKSVVAQLTGIGLTAAFCIPCALVLFGILKATLGIRVDADEERRGLDIGEHGMEAYGGFQIFTNQ